MAFIWRLNIYITSEAAPLWGDGATRAHDAAWRSTGGRSVSSPRCSSIERRGSLLKQARTLGRLNATGNAATLERSNAGCLNAPGNAATLEHSNAWVFERDGERGDFGTLERLGF